MNNYQVFTASGACIDIKAHRVINDSDEVYFIVDTLRGGTNTVAEFVKSNIEGWVLL